MTIWQGVVIFMIALVAVVADGLWSQPQDSTGA